MTRNARSTVIFGLLIATLGSSTHAGTTQAGFDQGHTAWTRVLRTHVTVTGPASRVNYANLKAHPQDLDLYIANLETVSSEDFSRFSENEKLAFLINAYNAFTLKLIIDHYPVKSIKDIGGVFSSPWKLAFFTLFGEKHRLDDIEHEMIRKKFNEPRIHFALVCAAKGCPALRPEAFAPEILDKQLNTAAEVFLRDLSHNSLDEKNGVLHLSSIFKWYGEDFEKKFGSVVNFVLPRLLKNPAQVDALKAKPPKIEYLDYDWSLNCSNC